MRDITSNNLVTAVVGGLILAAITFSFDEMGVPDAVKDMLRCDGSLDYEAARKKMLAASDLPQDERGPVEREIREHLVNAAECGLHQAQATHITSVCVGAFGFKGGRLEARRLISSYENRSKINTPTSPLSFDDLCPEI